MAFSGPGSAHELWLEPHDYTPEADGMLIADIVNGQEFEGVKLAYIPPRIANYVVLAGGQIARVEMRIGDTPGLNVPVLAEGLNVVGYESTVSTITYDDMAAFERFATHKDLGEGPEAVLAEHRARGLPEVGFEEAYFRFSKTLIGAGHGEGADTRLGLETEFVALTNPYVDDLSEGFRAALYYDGAVRADEQVEVFDKGPEGEVTITLLRTNDEGVVTVPVQPGHAYMLDAVVLRVPSPALAEATGAVWETLWANLTFAVPAVD